MSIDTLEAVLLVLLGGLFGWVLGELAKLDKRIPYLALAVALVVGIIVLGRDA